MILDRFKLTDKVAIVSGGGKGIAYAFAEAGADIVVAVRTEADLDETSQGVVERGRLRAPACHRDP